MVTWTFLHLCFIGKCATSDILRPPTNMSAHSVFRMDTSLTSPRPRRSISSPAWKKLPFHFHCSHVQRGMPSTSQPTLVSLAHHDFFLCLPTSLVLFSPSLIQTALIKASADGSLCAANRRPLKGTADMQRCDMHPIHQMRRQKFDNAGIYQLHISARPVKHKTSENPVIRNFGEARDSGPVNSKVLIRFAKFVVKFSYNYGDMIFNMANWKLMPWMIYYHTISYIPVVYFFPYVACFECISLVFQMFWGQGDQMASVSKFKSMKQELLRGAGVPSSNQSDSISKA